MAYAYVPQVLHKNFAENYFQSDGGAQVLDIISIDVLALPRAPRADMARRLEDWENPYTRVQVDQGWDHLKQSFLDLLWRIPLTSPLQASTTATTSSGAGTRLPSAQWTCARSGTLPTASGTIHGPRRSRGSAPQLGSSARQVALASDETRRGRS
eukprot:scaffold2120_cov259-Pinguiococcus_pyrenoidosus.AAC.8